MGDKYCGKCGSKLDKKTGLCPKCDEDQIRSRKRLNKESKVSDSNSQNHRNIHQKDGHRSGHYEKRTSFGSRLLRFVFKLLARLLLIAFLVLGAIIFLVYLDIVQFPAIETILYETGIKHNKGETGDFDEESINLEGYKVAPPDAEKLFQDNSKIIETVNAEDSTRSLTEADLIKILSERGFNEYPVTTEYNMQGNYEEPKSVVSSSSDKHPLYETSYINSSNEYWIITIVDGDLIAIPISFNMQSTSNTSVIISESETITSYDSSANKFYRTIPNTSVLTVKNVNHIDSDTLDSLTIEALQE